MREPHGDGSVCLLLPLILSVMDAFKLREELTFSLAAACGLGGEALEMLSVGGQTKA